MKVLCGTIDSEMNGHPFPACGTWDSVYGDPVLSSVQGVTVSLCRDLKYFYNIMFASKLAMTNARGEPRSQTFIICRLWSLPVYNGGVA